jgi:hypothetical protein
LNDQQFFLSHVDNDNCFYRNCKIVEFRNLLFC